MSNSIFTIRPYCERGQWMFDDVDRGLLKEPFVSGADEMIEVATTEIPNAKRGFTMNFSSRAFPGYQLVLYSRGPGMGGGTFYWCPVLRMECWLCPALFKYFKTAPARLYVQFKGGKK